MPTKAKQRLSSFHVLSDGITVRNELGKTVVAYKGQTFTVTEKLIAASLDREGNSFLDIIENPEAQLVRWGEIKLAPGPCPFNVEQKAHQRHDVYVRPKPQSSTRPADGYYPQVSVSHVSEEVDRAARIKRHFPND